MSRTSDIVVALATAQSPASGNPYHTQKSNLFQDHARFDAEVTQVTGAAVDFTTGNKQRITGAAGAIVLTAPGVGSYLLLIDDSDSFVSIADSGAGIVTWLGGVPTWADGKVAAIACYYDGTNWTLNGSVEE